MKHIRLTAIQTIALGFALLVLAGALILMLPVANRDQPLSFVNALFTSTSATCVTGLIVCDTYSQFTLFGQIVLLVLIQVGGLGFVSVMMLLAFALNRHIGLRERALLSESFSLSQVGGVVRLVRRILWGTAIVEGAGAVLLALRFVPRFGWGQGLWFAVFHSVSAFCNAGFDLMGTLEPYSSLTWWMDDWLVNGAVMALVLIGGIGFVVWSDLLDHRFRVRSCTLHTRTMLYVSALLVVVPALVLLFSERNAAMAGLNLSQRIWAALFQVVSPRTAGMNTLDLTAFSTAGLYIITGLMFIGAGPGSTGGGVKVTTMTVTLLSIRAYMAGGEDVNLLGRRIDSALARRAVLTTIFYFIVALAGVLVLELIQELPLRDVMMEVFSAVGTVGLSTGITRQLLPLSKLVLIVLMYSGRVGSLTVLLSVSEGRSKGRLRNPVEKIIVS